MYIRGSVHLFYSHFTLMTVLPPSQINMLWNFLVTLWYYKPTAVLWRNAHQLDINTNKTVEMLVDPRSVGDHLPVAVNGRNIRQVNSFKYLGIHIVGDLSLVCPQIHQCWHFLRRLGSFGVCRDIMMIFFYRATIESVLRYGVANGLVI